jgi:hypothetical protein
MCCHEPKDNFCLVLGVQGDSQPKFQDAIVLFSKRSSKRRRCTGLGGKELTIWWEFYALFGELLLTFFRINENIDSTPESLFPSRCELSQTELDLQVVPSRFRM